MTTKRLTLLGVILLALACLAPLSSRKPDAVQRVLGLPGGVDRVLRALEGIAITGTAIVIVLLGLHKLGGKR